MGFLLFHFPHRNQLQTNRTTKRIQNQRGEKEKKKKHTSRAISEMGTDQNGLMSRHRHGGATGGILGGDQNDVGEARWVGPTGVVVMGIDWGPKLEESNLGFEIFDLTLELLFRLVGLLVAFLACAGVTCAVVFLAGYAPHRLLRAVWIAFTFSVRLVLGPHRRATASSHLTAEACACLYAICICVTLSR